MLADLTEYSSLGNNEWRSYSVQFLFGAPRNISVTNIYRFIALFVRRIAKRDFPFPRAQLKFHGVIRNNAEDAIALDNIYVGGEQTTTTTPMPENPGLFF